MCACVCEGVFSLYFSIGICLYVKQAVSEFLLEILAEEHVQTNVINHFCLEPMEA